MKKICLIIDSDGIYQILIKIETFKKRNGKKIIIIH